MRKKNRGDLQKKKKKSSPSWLHGLCEFEAPECFIASAKHVLTFFFFFGDHPSFSLFDYIHTLTSLIKSGAASQRPAFVKKLIEKSINLVKTVLFD